MPSPSGDGRTQAEGCPGRINTGPAALELFPRSFSSQVPYGFNIMKRQVLTRARPFLPQAADQAPLHGQRLSQQTFLIQGRHGAVWKGELLVQGFCRVFQKDFVGPDDVGQAVQVRCNGRVVLLQLRQQIQPYPVAAVAPAVIGLIVADRQLSLGSIGCQFSLGHSQERADDVAPPGSHATKAVEAAAAQEMEQYRFGLVIGMMGHGNAVCPTGPGRFPQDAVTFPPPYGFFRSLFFPGQGRHVDILPGKTTVAAQGFLPNQGDFVVGSPADAVMDVTGRQA